MTKDASEKFLEALKLFIELVADGGAHTEEDAKWDERVRGNLTDILATIKTKDEQPITKETQTVTWIEVAERLPPFAGHMYPVAFSSGGVSEALMMASGDWKVFDAQGRLAAPSSYGCEVTHWSEPLKHPNELTK